MDQGNAPENLGMPGQQATAAELQQLEANINTMNANNARRIGRANSDNLERIREINRLHEERARYTNESNARKIRWWGDELSAGIAKNAAGIAKNQNTIELVPPPPPPKPQPLQPPTLNPQPPPAPHNLRMEI